MNSVRCLFIEGGEVIYNKLQASSAIFIKPGTILISLANKKFNKVTNTCEYLEGIFSSAMPTGGPGLDLLRPPPSHGFDSIGESFNICLILLVQRKI
jgi:hypothetical protein